MEAEDQLSNNKASKDTVDALERELKSKIQTIGTLKHDVVQLQGHLSEALQKLKAAGATGESVDRSVISNLLVQFLSCKKDEKKSRDILKIIASLLKLSAEDEVKIGLSADQSQVDTAKGSTDASFTDMWIAFLYKEAGL